jgi:hypothetical protein
MAGWLGFLAAKQAQTVKDDFSHDICYIIIQYNGYYYLEKSRSKHRSKLAWPTTFENNCRPEKNLKSHHAKLSNSFFALCFKVRTLVRRFVRALS